MKSVELLENTNDQSHPEQHPARPSRSVPRSRGFPVSGIDSDTGCITVCDHVDGAECTGVNGATRRSSTHR
jgi:hypothetical protein